MSPVSSRPTLPKTTPEDIVRRLTHLPSAPRVLPKLKRLLLDGNSSLHEVVALVRLDPGIAARVLQVGNSVYFNQGLRCYTVEEAVHRVGYDHIYELVANAVASEVLVRPLAVYSIGADELWESSVACAVAAEYLATSIGVDGDLAYTIGLLHRVGLVVINEWLERSAPGFQFTKSGAVLETCEEERNLLGFHNAEAGAALLRLWDFPAAMAEPVRWQYLSSATAAHGRLAALLAIARWVRTSALDGERSWAGIDNQVIRSAGISTAQLSPCLAHVRQRLREITSLLTDGGGRVALRFPGGERMISERGG